MVRFTSYLHTHRKRLGLTQKDVAFLAGMKGRGTISRFERQSRVPAFETMVALQIVFDVPMEALFPGIYKQVENNIHQRARELAESLSSAPHLPRARHRATIANAITARRSLPASYYDQQET